MTFQSGKYIFQRVQTTINRKCDWHMLLWEVPELREKIPSDFKHRTAVHLTWKCSLFRVWMLHIAVELGSLLGTRRTAWPGHLNWRNEGKTALELAEEKWGKDHEIKKLLQKETDNLVASGFLSMSYDNTAEASKQEDVTTVSSNSSRKVLKRKRETSPRNDSKHLSLSKILQQQ